MTKIRVTDRGGNELEVEAEDGRTMMEFLRELDEGMEALCGGLCSCSTCQVYVAPEWTDKLVPPQSDEMDLLEGSEVYRAGSSRLSCQIAMGPELDGIVVEIAPAE